MRVSRVGVQRVLQKYKETRSRERRLGSGQLMKMKGSEGTRRVADEER